MNANQNLEIGYRDQVVRNRNLNDKLDELHILTTKKIKSFNEEIGDLQNQNFLTNSLLDGVTKPRPTCNTNNG